MYMFWIYILQEKVAHFHIYRPPNVENLAGFFEEMTISLTKVTPSYENIFGMGDFNIEIRRKGVGSNSLSDFCDLFSFNKHSKIWHLLY